MAVSHIVGREILVPGSTSNLGPGFDALGLALQIYLRVRVGGAVDDGRGELRFEFVGGAPEGENAIERAIRELAQRRGLTLPSMALHVDSGIPVKAGLGSSAAAIVAGLRLVQLLDTAVQDGEVLDTATALEGHPDNVSASILGGLTASVQDRDGVVSACAAWPTEIGVVVATPDLALSTKAARAVLPDRVSRADAVFNVQRVTLFMQALGTRDFDLVRHALEDRLHQPYRSALVPGLEEALALEHPSLLGVFLSGAGPSIAALSLGDTRPVEELLARVYRALGSRCTIRPLAVHQPAAIRTIRSVAAPQPHLG
jgi:homoserine kinase